MALLDALKKRQTAQQTEAQNALAASQGSTQQAQQLIGAKSGKAGGGMGPKASAIGEGAALDEAKEALANQTQQQNLETNALGVKEAGVNAELNQKQQELNSQNQLAQEQLASEGTLAREGIAAQKSNALAKLTSDEQNKIEQVSAGADRAVQEMLSQKGITEDQIFEQFREDNRELMYRRDQAQLEQTAFGLAMRDKAYLDEINAIGETRRLSDSLEFAKESARLIMGENMLSVLQQIGFQERDLTDELEFNKKMAQLSLDEALAILNAQIAQDNQTAMIKGTVDLAGVGVDQYYKNQDTATPNGEGFAGDPMAEFENSDFYTPIPKANTDVTGAGKFSVTGG